MNPGTIAVARIAVLLLLVLNQALLSVGLSPLPFDDVQLETGVNTVLTVAASFWIWYKNNNLTKEAQEAQKILDVKKERKKGSA